MSFQKSADRGGVVGYAAEKVRGSARGPEGLDEGSLPPEYQTCRDPAAPRQHQVDPGLQYFGPSMARKVRGSTPSSPGGSPAHPASPSRTAVPFPAPPRSAPPPKSSNT